MTDNQMHGTTILSVRKDNMTVVIADGQITLGNAVVKTTARKLRSIANGKIKVGFAGSTADALTLFEKLESKLEMYQDQLTRACVELAKDWRTDKFLRKLEAMMIVVDKSKTFIISGIGDVIEVEDGIAAIGSGGNFALSAARALFDVDGLNAEKIARKSMKIAADLCIYSNHNTTIEIIE